MDVPPPTPPAFTAAAAARSAEEPTDCFIGVAYGDAVPVAAEGATDEDGGRVLEAVGRDGAAGGSMPVGVGATAESDRALRAAAALFGAGGGPPGVPGVVRVMGVPVGVSRSAAAVRWVVGPAVGGRVLEPAATPAPKAPPTPATSGVMYAVGVRAGDPTPLKGSTRAVGRPERGGPPAPEEEGGLK